ncbi:hypothetical protein ES705_49321 [subsurface metagenome]
MNDKEIIEKYRKDHPGEIEKLEEKTAILMVTIGRIVEGMSAIHGPIEGAKRLSELIDIIHAWEGKQNIPVSRQN